MGIGERRNTSVMNKHQSAKKTIIRGFILMPRSRSVLSFDSYISSLKIKVRYLALIIWFVSLYLFRIFWETKEKVKRPPSLRS